ncbi:MAG TPA: aminotransferase class V-fold PLP-dependent enzyme [bacterium]
MIYLDYAATSWPKPAACVRAMEHFMANIGSSHKYSSHQRARWGGDVIEEAREDVAGILGVSEPDNIIFTLNATTALNRICSGFLERGDQVLAGRYEHCSVTRPLAQLRKEKRIKVEKIGDCDTGMLCADDVHKALKENKAKLLVVSHASNVTGAIQPVKEIVDAAHEYGCAVLVDAAQTAGVLPIRTTTWNVDFLAFAGHKHLLGPMGVGGLYVAEPDRVRSTIVGSALHHDESDEMPEIMPHKFEAGTPNGPGIAGLGASCRAISEKGITNIRNEHQALIKRILKAFKEMPCVKLYGPTDPKKKVGVVSFNVCDMNPLVVGEYLDRNFEIMVRTGLCSSPWANHEMGTFPDGVVRASIGYFTKDEDVDLLIEAVGIIAQEQVAVSAN